MRLGILFFCTLLLDSCGNKETKIERAPLEEIHLIPTDTIPLFEENKTKEITSATCEYFESIEPTSKLRDKNTTHLLFAQRIGLDYGYKNDKAFFQAKDSLLKNGHLVSIEDCKYYKVKEMEHSFPYLTPEAASLLEEVGIRFNDKLKEKNQMEYAFFITSALRTDESQRRLFRRNKNATRSTTSHLYGTTFDLSYVEFHRNEDDTTLCYKNIQDIFIQTIREMRTEKCCLVMKEVKQKCFHITVIQ